METVRVALVGDQGVGKTSLILSGAHQTFRGDPSVTAVHPVRFRVSAQGTDCTCECFDTVSSEPESVQSAARTADVILVCYAMNDDVSLRNALERWLPAAKQANRTVPIIITGCKEDASTMTPENLAV
jgi:mitochondrial Rho GTPase 1